MSEVKRFQMKARVHSFVYAFRGLGHVLRTQHNIWLHLIVALAVVGLGTALHISRADWLWIIAAITFVFFAEIINSAFEFVCDVVSPAFNPSVEKAKDIAAGAVLIAAFGAVLIGVLVFWPHIFGG